MNILRKLGGLLNWGRDSTLLDIPTIQSLDVENGVLRGNDGWLFLWDGSNEVHRYFTDPKYFTHESANDWVELIKQRKTMVEAVGARYRQTIVPDKLSLYSRYLPFDLPLKNAHPTARMAEKMRGQKEYVDLLPDLLGTRSSPADLITRTEGSRPGTDAYFIKTDSHWTFEGCQIAYLRLCESLGITPCDFSDRKAGAGRMMKFDLGNKLSPPVMEHGRFVQIARNSRRVFANSSVVYNETEGFTKGAPRFVGCNIHNHNDHPDAIAKTLVLFGDSFCEFRTTMLTAMFSETFRDVYFVWSLNFDAEYIRRISPDIVIGETAERFCQRLPTDDYAVPE